MLPNCQLVSALDTQFLLLKNNDLISNAIRRGGYEIEVIRLANKVLEKHKDGLVLDIGANLGSFCLPVAKTNQGITFHAFEPQRIVYYQLCANTFVNGFENVHCHRVALSDIETVLALSVPDYSKEINVGAFSIDREVRDNEYECQTTGDKEAIQTRPLDQYQFCNVRLIKADVEGHELEALKGGEETIKSNNYPPIIFEAWDWKPWFAKRREDLFEYLEGLGYEIIKGGTNNFAQHPEHGEMIK